MRLLLAIVLATAGPAMQHTSAGTKLAQAALLRVTDLGKGWTSKASAQQGVSFTCKGYAPSAKGVVETGAAASPDFSLGNTGPFISQQVSVYGSVAQATTWWRQAVTPSLVTCVRQNVEVLRTKGATVTIKSQGAFKLATQASRTAAYRVVARVNKLTLYFDVIVIGSGKSISTIVVSSFQSASPSGFEQVLAHDVVARMGPQAA